MSGQTKEQKYEALAKEILTCRACQADFGFEPHPIIFGSPKAKIMQIGQAPSLLVQESGRPFTDASGDKLKKEWYQITDEAFYNPENFYIGMMAHCYPGKKAGGRGDNPPPKRCAKLWLENELPLVENELYIIIGSYAAKYFFPKEKLTDLIFQDKYLNGKLTYVIPHPSPLNFRFFAKHPEFQATRIKEIRQKIKEVLR